MLLLLLLLYFFSLAYKSSNVYWWKQPRPYWFNQHSVATGAPTQNNNVTDTFQEVETDIMKYNPISKTRQPGSFL